MLSVIVQMESWLLVVVKMVSRRLLSGRGISRSEVLEFRLLTKLNPPIRLFRLFPGTIRLWQTFPGNKYGLWAWDRWLCSPFQLVVSPYSLCCDDIDLSLPIHDLFIKTSDLFLAPFLQTKARNQLSPPKDVVCFQSGAVFLSFYRNSSPLPLLLGFSLLCISTSLGHLPQTKVSIRKEFGCILQQRSSDASRWLLTLRPLSVAKYLSKFP